MRKKWFIFIVILALAAAGKSVSAQNLDILSFDRFKANPFYSGLTAHAPLHAGIHSGLQTIKREQLLEKESKDQYRSCRDPYCNRCAKHLADYGHEYQYLSGVNQRQLWYRGTAGTIAPVRQFGYDAHGIPYARRGQPAAVMSQEYVRTLNRAVWEQTRARNAVAAEEAAEERAGLLAELRDAALAQLQKSRNNWESLRQSAQCIHGIHYGRVHSPCSQVLKHLPEDYSVQFTENIVGNIAGNIADNTVQEPAFETVYNSHAPRFFGLCEYCAAKAQFLFDRNYVAEVERELGNVMRELERRTAVADEAVRAALRSKPDADKATRFKRIQMKPPKYQDILMLRESEQNGTENNTTPDTESEESPPISEN
jgi:hypothetical protein